MTDAARDASRDATTTAGESPFALAFDGDGGLDALLGLEWLETNGIGGWSSASVCGANTRRYHGLLVAALNPPLGRMVLLSKLEETVIDGDLMVPLATNRFPGATYPDGWKLLRRFVRDIFPSTVFEAASWRIRRAITAVHGENTVIVTWELEGDKASVGLELRPFFAARDYHALAHANDSVHRSARFENGLCTYRMYEGVPEVFLALPGATYTPAADWYYNFLYERETDRGLDDREDLFTPGILRVELRRGEPLRLIATIHHDSAAGDANAIIAREAARRSALLDDAPTPHPVTQLMLAADQFIVRRGESGRSVIAGYHWFGDWGRDTMIALPGLCLTTKRFDDAKAILSEFASVVSEGMLPNRFPDGGEAPEYNTVDAALWFFVAIHRTIEATGDREFASTMLPVLEDIVAWHQRGTRHGIRVDADGLLRAGEPGVQLTWMDARVGDEVITPRDGKAVEINALWYNGLRILASLRRSNGDAAGAVEADARADDVQRHFLEVFWNAADDCLYDTINETERDSSLRPNQIFAISLPFPLLTGDRAAAVLAKIERHLLTPFGLRSLAREDPRYAPSYSGGPRERDRVYHQGTVWSWLLGPYLTALVRVRGDEGRVAARRILDAFLPHLREAGIGGISEIFDAEPPFAPRGCITQAWSVAEILRAAVEDAGLAVEPSQPPRSNTRSVRDHATEQP